MAEPLWFYVQDDQRQGPVPLEEIVTRIRSGAIPRSVLVWREGLTDWAPAHTVPEISPRLPAALPPAPPRVPPPAPPKAPPPAPPGRAQPRAGAQRAVPVAGEFQRPGVLTLLAVLDFLAAGGMLLTVPLFVVVGISQKKPETVIASVLFGALGALYLFAGLGLWRLKAYGRRIQIGFAIVGLLGFPLGTIISILILVYLSKAAIKILFSGRTPAELEPGEAAEVARLGQSSGAVWVLVGVGVLVLVVAMVGIIAAIAIPSLLRARVSANEAAAIGDVRTLISAEMIYESENHGYFEGRGECLLPPAGCIPGRTGPAFLGAPIVDATKAGYVRKLYSGPTVAPRSRAGASPSSTTAFAMVAYPVSVGQTGVRGFCGDSTGVVRFTPDGSEPRVTAGACDVAMPALQ